MLTPLQAAALLRVRAACVRSGTRPHIDTSLGGAEALLTQLAEALVVEEGAVVNERGRKCLCVCVEGGGACTHVQACGQRV